jgi:hypothetical protein
MPGHDSSVMPLQQQTKNLPGRVSREIFYERLSAQNTQSASSGNCSQYSPGSSLPPA